MIQLYFIVKCGNMVPVHVHVHIVSCMHMCKFYCKIQPLFFRMGRNLIFPDNLLKKASLELTYQLLVGLFESHCRADPGLGHTILLLKSPECWDYRYLPTTFGLPCNFPSPSSSSLFTPPLFFLLVLLL